MFKLTLLLVCAVALQQASARPKLTGSGKIIGGQESTQGQFPFLVSLQDASNRGHFCGGAIVSDRHVVTAGHCFYGDDNPATTVVFAGSNDLSGSGTTYKLQRVLVHEDYDDWNIVNDITLLQTSQPIQFNANVSPINLPAANLNLAEGTPLTALGWGTIRYPNTQYPDISHFVGVGVVPNNKCQSQMGTIENSQICVGGVNGQGLCYGDSGSPLVYNGNTTVGIVSWGNPCAVGYPDVFTRVSSFVDWVQRNSALLATLDDQ